MADALFLIVVVGFFGLMVLLVKACDHIIGPDDGVGTAPPPVTVPAAAPSELVGGAAEAAATSGSELL